MAVLALVFVRWPRTGRPIPCLFPRHVPILRWCWMFSRISLLSSDSILRSFSGSRDGVRVCVWPALAIRPAFRASFSAFLSRNSVCNCCRGVEGGWGTKVFEASGYEGIGAAVCGDDRNEASDVIWKGVSWPTLAVLCIWKRAQSRCAIWGPTPYISVRAN